MGLFSIRGVYENGVVKPLEPLPEIHQSEVIITFLTHEPENDFEILQQRYITAAIERADYQKLRDKTYSGTIPDCPGVVAFRETLTECQRELVSVLQDWILVKQRRGVPIPVIDGLDLNEAENG